MPRPKPETIARNQALGIKLTSDGKRSATPATYSEEEEQTYTHGDYCPEDCAGHEDGRVDKRWRPVPRDEIRCRAIIRTSTSAWRGNQCCKIRMKGAVVCRTHGGTLPSVKKAAQRRLAMAADPAAKQLIYIALKKPGVEDRDRIRAIIEILNRAGVEGKTTVELEIKPWQAVLQRVYSSMDGSKPEADLELEEGVDFDVLDEEEA